jgi:hypothetical protein
MAGPSTFVDAGMDVHGPGLVSTLIIYLQLLQYLIFIAEFNAEVKKICCFDRRQCSVFNLVSAFTSVPQPRLAQELPHLVGV